MSTQRTLPRPRGKVFVYFGYIKTHAPHTIEEGLNGLHPYWFNINQAGNTTEFKSTSYLLGQESSVEFPSFESFIATLLTEIENAKTSHDNAIFVAS